MRVTCQSTLEGKGICNSVAETIGYLSRKKKNESQLKPYTQNEFQIKV